MPELTFVDKSTVELISVHGDDDDICHAAWVSNYDTRSLPEEHKRPYKDTDWVGSGVDENGKSYQDYEGYERGWIPSKEWLAWEKKTSRIRVAHARIGAHEGLDLVDHIAKSPRRFDLTVRQFQKNPWHVFPRLHCRANKHREDTAFELS